MAMRFAAVLAAAVLLLAGTAAGQKLTVNATKFYNNDPVSVVLSGVTTPTVNDSVGLFLANAANPDELRPLKYKWAVTGGVPGAYLKSGTAKFTFYLLNQRDDVIFMFFNNINVTGGFTSAQNTANSSVITNAAPNAPQHGHLALTGVESEMLIQWTTRDKGSPEVQWGLSATALTHTAKGSGFTYNRSDLCGAPAITDGWVDPGYLQSAKMTGLKDSTRYYYKYGQTGDFSKVYSFLTAGPVGSTTNAKMILIADLGHTELDYSDEYDYDPSGDTLNLTPDGTANMVVQTVKQLVADNAYQQSGSRMTTDAIARDLENEPDKTLFMLNGDVSYARGMQTMWDVFMDQLQEIGTQVPWMLTNGNHERDFMNSGDRYNNDTFTENYDSGGECGLVYNNRFQMPKPPGPATVAGGYIKRNDAPGSFVGPDIIPLWYSFDHGPTHNLVYSTELDFYPGSPQYQFMEADLKAVNRTKTPWVILHGHRPIYTTSTAGAFVYGVPQVASDLREAIENLIYTYSVDLTLHGHDHIYERTCSIFNYTCMPNNADGSQGGVTHVVIGNAGYELSWFYNPFYPQYWKKIAIEHGYMRCEVNAETMYCQELSSFTGKQLDEFTLKKPKNWKPDTAGRMTTAATLVPTHVLSNIEANGFIGQPYSAILTPLLANMSANSVLLQNIIDQNNLMGLAIDHAIEQPDTVVDDCEVLSPAISIIEDIVANNETTPEAITFATTAVLPLYKAVCAAAYNYKNANGVVAPTTFVIKDPLPLKVAFAQAAGLPYEGPFHSPPKKPSSSG